MPVIARFKAIDPTEVEYLRNRGAERPEQHTDGFRLTDPLYKLPDITCFEKPAKLIFCSGSGVRQIETLASVAADGSAAFVLWEAVPRLFSQAMAEGAPV